LDFYAFYGYVRLALLRNVVRVRIYTLYSAKRLVVQKTTSLAVSGNNL